MIINLFSKEMGYKDLYKGKWKIVGLNKGKIVRVEIDFIMPKWR